ncbi:MAG: class I SAM-dependent methyltransferase [Anaerolineae bacterium]|nr:class I SAM-dependent methyltransferase [Anaerolineae bacterium]MDQ7033348.1 class I SAM-dependent methyltransferase [Anaerolineae bacterium]
MPDLLDSQLYNLFDTYPSHIVPFLQFLVQAYNLPTEPYFLDVGCGTGRLLEPCSALGWRVDALEPNSTYFAAAAQIAQKSDTISVQQGGFESIHMTGTYDLIAAVNAPFAYLLTITEREDALARIFAALKAGGVVFLDIYNFLWMLRHYRPPKPSFMRDNSGAVIKRVIRHDIDWYDSTFTHTDTFYRNDQLLSTQIHCMAMITSQEIRHLVAAVGFQHIQTYNNFAARQHQRIKADRIMLSAQKPL